ncbi:hypothetical protein [uncultured phage cr61_1]|uniref:DUF669 domain-containing protein n=1 Tax=uncultured phage cr61_1 TaxID=2986417 RepID=A0AAE7S2M3_9CAUD|nr:hypothetical protein OJM08_gp37 [uncultured phage cr61_1]QWM90605.1 hypothetical protein [uncultured phage cr61_1]
MYNTNTAITSNDEFVSSYMPAGINENVFLKSVEAKKSPTGKDFLEITFENNEGQTAQMSEWKNEKSMWTKTDEDLQRRDNMQFGRIMQIINCYFPKIEGEFNTFKEMIDWVQSTLTPMVATKKALRLKVVYDKNNYTQVSKNGIFVEPMDKAETEIKKFARDNFERQVVADVETSTDPLAATPTVDSTQVSGSDDLPF